LHGVALRLARKAKAEAARAGRGDVRPAPESPTSPAAEASWREVRQILDDELQRLPESYRLPLVLFYVEGRTRDEAAAELGWTPARLKGLLERGRERLRGRLIRRGLAPAAAGAVLLAETALAAPVPPLLAVATLRAALRLGAGELLRACGVSATVVRLTEGGVGIMGSNKVLLVLVFALGLGAIGTGAGFLAQWPISAAASESAAEPVAAMPPAQQPEQGASADDRKDDRKAIQGLWRVESILVNGKDWDDELGRQQKKAHWRITADSFEIELDGEGKKVIYAAHAYKIDPTRTPKTWDTFPLSQPGMSASKKRQQVAVYALEGDTLKICIGSGTVGDPPGERERPKEVVSKEGSQTLLYTLKRMKPDGDKPRKEKAKDDQDALRGVWQVDSVIVAGKNATDKWPQNMREWVITDKGGVLLRAKGAGEVGYQSRLTVDPSRRPKEIDVMPITMSGPAERHPNRGVYSLDGDVWKVCFPRGTMLDGWPRAKAQDRQKELTSTEANGGLLITLKRVKPDQDKLKTDQEKLHGTWQPISRQFNGESVPSLGPEWWSFKDNTVTRSLVTSAIFSKFTLDAAKDPKRLTIITNVAPDQEVEVPCIYKLEGDVLTLCFDGEGRGGPKKRQPTQFTGKAGTGMMLLVLKRVPLKVISNRTSSRAVPPPGK
jgi:uncharacterized protein (TIGR03067 family)